jgi:hypothetical protein
LAKLNSRLSEKETREWIVTARLAGVAIGLAILVVWRLLLRS